MYLLAHHVTRMSEAEKLARLQQKAAYIEQQRQLNATFGRGRGGYRLGYGWPGQAAGTSCCMPARRR